MNLDETIARYRLLAERKKYERWRYYKPVPKQKEFLDAGAESSERLLLAGNGCGKTETAAFEVSCHMTGQYPPWWEGVRYDRPVRVWAAGTSAKAVTDAAQTKLLGPPGDKENLGTGLIPRAAIVGEPRPSRGYPDSVDNFQVRHASGGISRCVMKTYQQQRADWQGADIDILWPDEEPPADLYAEGQARLRGRGITLMTFTPMLGMSEIVLKFLEEDVPGRMCVQMGLNDATWYTEAERRRMLFQYPANERDARAWGLPTPGAGKVFQAPLDDLLEPPIPFGRVPAHWAKIWGIDFGGSSDQAHPFAAVLLAWDKDNPPEATQVGGPVGTMHVLAEVRMNNTLVLQHADAMKKIAANVPVAWPHDGHVKERSSGKPAADIYRSYGLRMLDSHATDVMRGRSTYAGIWDLDGFMQARQFKVSSACTMWQQEYGLYHYKNGVLVKVRDDLMSATRTGHQMRRYARPGLLGPSKGSARRNPPPPRINPWTGREAFA